MSPQVAHLEGGLLRRVDRIPGCEGLVPDLDRPWARIDALPEETEADPDDE